MSKRYEPQDIEKKWQKIWQDEKAFAATDDYTKPKYYALVEFPYPSGQGLHVGHPRPYTALDIVARKRRMQGYNVLYPMGWDAFGLPTENYAIKNHIHPKIVTKNNVHHFKDQLQSLGYSFDWDREINTTDPEYYHWTQWIFLKLFKAGLAYKKEMPINWCTSCKVGLANEEVVNGVCERCGSPVVRKVKSEWMLKITEYADKLIDGLDGLAVGVSSIAAITMLAVALLTDNMAIAITMAALTGACIGFMPYNLNPAKIFMGDTGSTFLGYMLATVSIMGLFKFYAVISFAVPFLILGLPIFDTANAIIRRLAEGRSPMSPDRGHVHHKLIDMGFNQKQAVAILYAISATLGLTAVVLTSSGEVKAVVLLAAVLAAILVGACIIYGAEHWGKHPQEQKKHKNEAAQEEKNKHE